MTPDDRRRLGAVSALVLGVFLGLSLVPTDLTGAAGDRIRGFLLQTLGAGALFIPVVGILIALAGFNRLPFLDMKRAAALASGLALLVPYFIGVLAGVDEQAFAMQAPAAALTGVVPGFLAREIVQVVGKAGGVLIGFLLLTGLTLLTLAWHPLQRLEKTERVEAEPEPQPVRARRPPPQPPVEEEGEEEEPQAGPRPAPRPPRPRKEQPARTGQTGQAEDELPPLDLLSPPPVIDTAKDAAQLDRLGDLLLEALRTFKVECSIAGRTSGPVVTQFEVVPAPGVKVGRIMALSDDLAIKMRTPSVRVAPIPGKGAVGVEVPNPTARMVTLRELLDAPEWDRSRATLPIALGRDLEGRPVITDLAKTPHLLIAGATGSGKSVAVNTIITALVYRYTPTELRFLMVDPKMVELSMYNALPHMRHRVVTDSRDAATVLKWAVYEMGRRYELLHANGARNIGDFNRKVEEGKPLRNPSRPRATLTEISAEPADSPPVPEMPDVYGEGVLPYIVIVVDELADLMMTVQGEVETPLALLAQKARAIGIHLILATQRPSVNVITGLIKANFPSRIAFRVASKVDSRTILDQNGAEALLGNGDMLFLPPGKSEPMRLQGAFIATEETERVMHWYEARKEARAAAAAQVPAEPDILELVRAQESDGEEAGAQGDAADRDTLFREAAEVCVQNQGGSTSLLQRKLRIGYGRAARIIDQLHYAGILGPPDGSKPREVLIGLDQLDEYSQ